MVKAKRVEKNIYHRKNAVLYQKEWVTDIAIFSREKKYTIPLIQDIDHKYIQASILES